jgi:hypothetical protein
MTPEPIGVPQGIPYRELVGAWPDTAVVVTFDHPEHDGVRLRRRVPLSDQFGRRSPPEYADVYLGECLATVRLPQLSVGRRVLRRL